MDFWNRVGFCGTCGRVKDYVEIAIEMLEMGNPPQLASAEYVGDALILALPMSVIVATEAFREIAEDEGWDFLNLYPMGVVGP